MKAIILAGGMGKRMRPLTDTVPKPMVLVADKPILQWQMDWMKGSGVQEFVLCVGHLKEKIIEFFGDGSRFGVRVDYVIEEEPLGTAGALRNALPHFPQSEPFFSLNGDNLIDLDLRDLRAHRDATGAVGSLALVPLPCPYGVVMTDDRGYVTSFVEKPRLMEHWINPGVYCLHPSISSYLPEKGSLELEVFPRLAGERKLTAARYPDSFWMSVDSPKDVEEATKALRARR